MTHMTDMEMTECDTQVNHLLVVLVLPPFSCPLSSCSVSFFVSLFSNFAPQYALSIPYLLFTHLTLTSPISQVHQAQTFHQISQDSPSHSAVQTRCSEIFLVGRIPLLVSLVSHKQYTVHVRFNYILINSRDAGC